MHEKYYHQNTKYANFLNNQSDDHFKKYIDFINKYNDEGNKILDVGCGTGNAINKLKEGISCFGIDISEKNINECKKKGLSNCILYDGEKIPFEDGSFDFVGSYNVLEHTDNPINFLNENLRVLKTNGYILIACPNFLSISNNYHHHTAGIYQKIKNLINFFKILINGNIVFNKMKTIEREDFQPDDDACNITNPLSVLIRGNKNNLETIYRSSQSFYSKGLVNKIDFSIFRYFLGASFVLFKKK